MSSDEQREGARAWTKERAEAARRRCADAPLEPMRADNGEVWPKADMRGSLDPIAKCYGFTKDADPLAVFFAAACVDLPDALDAIDERDATIAELEAHLVTMTAAHAKAANERDAFARSLASYQTLCEGLTRSVEDLSAALERERAMVQQSSAPSPSAEGAKLEPAADDGEIDRWEAQLARRRASMADTAKGGAS